VCKVWSPIGSRPIASVHHCYQWTYVYGFVCPTTRATECYILPGVNIDGFNLALLTFAEEEDKEAKLGEANLMQSNLAAAQLNNVEL